MGAVALSPSAGRGPALSRRPALRRAGGRSASAPRAAAGPGVPTVAVTGATGFVGRALVASLLENGYGVRVLTRDAGKARRAIPARLAVNNPDGLPQTVEFLGSADWDVSGCAAVVNLAGESIVTRWSEGVKRRLVSSRVDTTERVAGLINACAPSKRPKVLVSASAVGYYGTSDDAEFDEGSPPGGDFLAELCVAWEGAAKAAKARVVQLRVGIVLDAGGGAVGAMTPAFSLGGGGPLGRGTQPLSWVHRDDLVAMVLRALEDERWEGPVNATAPEPTTAKGLSDAMGAALLRPAVVPVPEAALNLLLAEGAGVLTEGQRVLPRAAEKLGFEFTHTNVRGALFATFPNKLRDMVLSPSA